MNKEEQLKLLYRKRDCLLEAKEINDTLMEDYLKQNKVMVQEMYSLMMKNSYLSRYDECMQNSIKQGIYRVLGISSVAAVVSSFLHSDLLEVVQYGSTNILVLTGLELVYHVIESCLLKSKMPRGDLEQFELQYYDTDEKLKGANCGLYYLYEKDKQLNISLAEHDYSSISKENSTKEKIKR